MNKKSQTELMFIVFSVFIVIAVIVIWSYGISSSHLEQEAISKGEICGDFTSLDSAYSCCEDCEKLNMEYLKYEFSASLLGANVRNCYCKDINNDVSQIW